VSFIDLEMYWVRYYGELVITSMKEKRFSISFWDQRWFGRTFAVFMGMVAAVGVIHFQITRLTALSSQNSQSQSKSEHLAEEQAIQYNLRTWQKTPRFGFDNLVANWTFLNFIQYFGDDTARKSTGYTVTPEFFKVIVKRDPLFLGMYPYLSPSVTLFAGQPQQTVMLIEQGIKAIPSQLQPEAYFLWQAKGTDELLFLGRNDAAQNSYEQAANWASRSSDPQIQAIADRSRQTARFLASNPDSRRARVASWFNILTNAIDDSTRQFAVQQITALGGKISVAENGALQVKLPKQD
jgi:hypothetical protein